MSKPKNQSPTEAKLALAQDVRDGKLTIGQAVRRMRQITGLNQKDYATRIVGISPRILAEIERDEGNPTVETLNKLGRPFGYKAGFIHLGSE